MDTDTTGIVVEDEAIDEAIMDEENKERVLLAAKLDKDLSLSPNMNILEQDHPLCLEGKNRFNFSILKTVIMKHVRRLLHLTSFKFPMLKLVKKLAKAVKNIIKMFLNVFQLNQNENKCKKSK